MSKNINTRFEEVGYDRRLSERARLLSESHTEAAYAELSGTHEFLESMLKVQNTQVVHQPNLRGLRDGLKKTFSLTELESACLDLGIEFEDLLGNSLEQKITQLIKYSLRRGKLQDLIDYVKEERPQLNITSIIRSTKIDPTTVESRQHHRDTLKRERKDIFLVHALRPSRNQRSWFDILIYLIPHKDTSLKSVEAAEFFLGHYWGNRIFHAKIQEDFVGISISAYGPTLCTCLVKFKDNTQVLLERYIDFEMAQTISLGRAKAKIATISTKTKRLPSSKRQ